LDHGSWSTSAAASTTDNTAHSDNDPHALVDTLHHWHAAIDKGQSVRTVFVDFAKAFDHVDHNILVTKLVALGLPDVIVRWMCVF